jgi:hypothetical protein
MYFWIEHTQYDTIIKQLTETGVKEELRTRLAFSDSKPPQFAGPARDVYSFSLNGNWIALIRGEMVIPRPINVVTEYELQTVGS